MQGGKKNKKGCFKHTLLGVCQNTLPSSNWVISDTTTTPTRTTRCQPIDGEASGEEVGRLPGACEASLAPNQSAKAQTLPRRQSGRDPARHAGSRNIHKTHTHPQTRTAPQHPPVPPGRNWYTGIPLHFQRPDLNPHVYYEIGYFVPPPPPPSALPPTSPFLPMRATHDSSAAR